MDVLNKERLTVQRGETRIPRLRRPFTLARAAAPEKAAQRKMPQAPETIPGKVHASGSIQTYIKRKALMSQNSASTITTTRDESHQPLQKEPLDPSNIEIELAYYKHETTNLQRTVDELLNELGERERKVQELTKKLCAIKYLTRGPLQPSGT